MAKVKIESNQHGRGDTYIDGERVNNVRSAWVSMGYDQLTTVELSFLSSAVEFEGEADVIAVIDGKKYKLVEE